MLDGPSFLSPPAVRPGFAPLVVNGRPLVRQILASRLGNPTTGLILGLMFGYAVSALVTGLVGASQPERLQQWSQWGFGSFSGVTWQRLRLFAPSSSGDIPTPGGLRSDRRIVEWAIDAVATDEDECRGANFASLAAFLRGRRALV
jgi:hypothetical protein